MKIQEVTIEGFQSHVQSTFNLSPGLTVITGPSDAGKTAIIRALRWFAFNEPTGEAFLHTIRNPDGSVKEAVDQAKVSVTFDNGVTVTKTRRKGKTSYTHSSYQNGWEKAEIPPEIKETLGLVKQQYGDFETCLNFAFQLDPPFLLSETASIGAKVLGKLAGTEVVDKSISEVNKKTHQVRTEISYADKQIGEIDVSLIEYFELDTKDQQLTKAEEAFTRLQEARERRGDLIKLTGAYEQAVDRRISYFDEVQRLAGVVVAGATLSIVEREQRKVERLTELNKAVADQKEPCRVIHLTRGLKDLDKLLTSVEADTEAYGKLVVLQWRHEQAQKVIYETSGQIVKLDQGIGLKFMLEDAEADYSKLMKLEALYSDHGSAVMDANGIGQRLDAMEATKAVRGKYEALVADYKTLEGLQRVGLSYTQKNAYKIAAERNVQRSTEMVEAARKELHESWEAAGGVCPLCGSKGVAYEE